MDRARKQVVAGVHCVHFLTLLVLITVQLSCLPGDYFDPMFVKPMVALRPLHYSAEVGPRSVLC